ncbi:MAG: cation diffusion facilitator family transporter [Desulfuromonadales bacterium]|nr:cation diffusion facilitator family transporter [Desulfuromonadales bacterium]
MEISEKTAWLSILTNLTLVGIKSALVALSGSLAIKADAIHSLSDVASSAIILTGIKISQRSSRRFPYGLYKVENMASLGTSFLIFYAGYEILMKVFLGPPRTLPSQIPVAAAGVSLTILITWLFSRYELKKGHETGSPSLVADARHVWTDMLSSLVILASLLGSAIGLAVDRYAAVIVVAFIARSAFAIFLDSVRVLLDASLDYDSLNRIREIALADPRVVNINELRARNAGRYKFVELDLTLRARELERGHRISEEIKQRIKKGLENVDHVLIHYEPCQKDHLILGVPLCGDRQAISEHFGEAPFFRLLTVRPHDGTITADSILSNPYIHEEKAKGIKVANWLLEAGLDVMIVRQDIAGKGPGFVLGNADVEILVVSETDTETALAMVKADLEKSKTGTGIAEGS